MGELVARPAADLTEEQLSLIKSTVAKGATNEELKLFLYRAKNLGLDPLKPGQIYFIKYGTSPGTIVVGIDGFRSKASRTGKLKGVQRGILRDEKGKCIGAWCEIYRSDWDKPAREEVSLAEYNTGKSQWAKMPETMIKKVAEVAALRMAFPEDLGGVYSEEEMDQAGSGNLKARAIEAKVIDSLPPPEYDADIDSALENAPKEIGPGDYIIKIGKKHKGKKLSDLTHENLRDFANWVNDKIANKDRDTLEFLDKVAEYLEQA